MPGAIPPMAELMYCPAYLSCRHPGLFPGCRNAQNGIAHDELKQKLNFVSG